MLLLAGWGWQQVHPRLHPVTSSSDVAGPARKRRAMSFPSRGAGAKQIHRRPMRWTSRARRVGLSKRAGRRGSWSTLKGGREGRRLRGGEGSGKGSASEAQSSDNVMCGPTLTDPGASGSGLVLSGPLDIVR